MIYGDLQFFDIIIFAGVALFLIYRLKNILGKRTGFEKPPNTKPEFQTSKNPPEIRKDLPELSENIAKLKLAYEKIEGFEHKSFLEGAKIAFETIINSFNKGDKKTLKKLLTKEVFKSFEEAIDAKTTDPNYQFYSLNIESIEDVQIENGLVKISIKFASEQFKDNDESTVIKKQDIWTFEKPTNSKDPNWLLSST